MNANSFNATQAKLHFSQMPVLFFQLPHVFNKCLLMGLQSLSARFQKQRRAGGLTKPAKRPSFVTQTYLSPNFTKHSYTKSIGERISSAIGAWLRVLVTFRVIQNEKCPTYRINIGSEIRRIIPFIIALIEIIHTRHETQATRLILQVI
jgi:hypothetical protein